MRVILVADVPERLARQQAFTPSEPNRILSDEQMQYVAPIPAMEAKYAANPIYNGSDALRRLRTDD